MITDSLKNCATYETLHKDFKKVFEALQKLDGNVSEAVVLDKGNVWINPPSLTQVPEGAREFEAHRDFIDIHYILSGSEAFGYANVECLKTTKEYDKADDYLLLDGDKSLITLNAGDFCITFPQDAHIPFCQKRGEEPLVRAVAKIRL